MMCPSSVFGLLAARDTDTYETYETYKQISNQKTVNPFPMFFWIVPEKPKPTTKVGYVKGSAADQWDIFVVQSDRFFWGSAAERREELSARRKCGAGSFSVE